MPIRVDYAKRESRELPLITKIGLTLFIVALIWGYVERMPTQVQGTNGPLMISSSASDVVFQCERSSRLGNTRWLPGKPNTRVLVDPDSLCPEDGLLRKSDIPDEEVWYYKHLLKEAEAEKLLPKSGRMARSFK